jgi:anti-anti-sigma factor
MANRPAAPGLDVREADGRITAVVTGCTELVDGTAEPLAGQLAALIEGRQHLHLAVDLAAVTFISSAALAQFHVLHRTLQAGGGHLSLWNLAPHVREVFALTQLDRIIDVHPDSVSA